jgi:hypothetical protein
MIDVRIEVLRLSTAVAELQLTVPGGELRGRLTGPHHPSRTTLIESYVLKPGPGGSRVIITDPIFWTAEQPYVYRGDLEEWRDGTRVGERPVEVGLKQAGG